MENPSNKRTEFHGWRILTWLNFIGRRKSGFKFYSLGSWLDLTDDEPIQSPWLCATLLLLLGFSYSSPISKLPWLPLQLFPNPSLHLPLLLPTEPPTTISTTCSWVSEAKTLAGTSPITSTTLWQMLDSAPSETTMR